MGTPAFIALLAVSTVGASIPQADVEKQNEAFKTWWDTDFTWKFDDLPTEGSVPKFRIPYSGYIYPDTSGGTTNVLHKYDRAFGARAVSHERWDTTAFKEPVERRGFLGRRRFTRMRTPDWYGHCNGWTAAAIRHAEPQHSVTMNGITFTPADIKGLLAEIYIYNDHTVLTGEDTNINAGVFHALITNWLGRGSHALAMEADPTDEKWNYPIYAYAVSFGRHSGRQVEVKMNIAFAKDSDGEYQESPRIKEIKYFHYMLNLDFAGNIVGGHFYRDSSVIDMLWIPVQPKPAGQEGNERGNPYVDVSKVLALWRASVPYHLREKWLNIDPAIGESDISIEEQQKIVMAEKKAEAEAAAAAEAEAEAETARRSISDELE